MDPSVPAPFPSTMWSEVLSLRESDPQARRDRLSRLIERYWKPVYWAVRAQSNVTQDDARDLTQDFFVRILDGYVLETVDPAKGSFRNYLKGGLKYFLVNEWRKGQTRKKVDSPLSLDFDAAGREPPALGTEPGAALDRAWAAQLLEGAMEELAETMRAAGRGRDAEVFAAWEAEPENAKPTYEALGARFGVGARDVWNGLRYCRRELRTILMKRVQQYVKDEGELFDELRELFGS